MSATLLHTGHAQPDDLVLYALQFLPADDASAIAQHLEQCTECRSEVARIHGDLALYASSTELTAPAPETRQRLMQQIAREKKIVSIASAVTQPAAAAAPLSTFGRTGSILSSIEDVKPRRRTGLAVFGWSGWAVAAGLAVAATTVYKQRESLRNEMGVQTTQMAKLAADSINAHRIVDALNDPKAVRVTLSSKPKTPAVPLGRATYNPDKGTLLFIATDLDPLQMYKVYELWLIPTEGKPIPAGTFHPDDRGNASVIMPDIPKGVQAKAFGVTVEDDGGSPTPTSAIVMAGS